MYDSDSNQALYAFIASLAFHLLVFLFFSQLAEWNPVSEKDTPMEIVFTEPKNKMEFIQAPQIQKEEKTKPKKEAKFKSDKTQRTDLETFARPQMPTEMQAPIASGGQGGKSEKSNDSKKEKTFAEGDFKPKDDREVLILPGYGSTSAPPTIPAYVQQQMPPGVRLGNITALNTDQHRFYSFNQRLLSRFIPVWGQRVRGALYQWLKENNAPPISKTWVTNVEIIMNEKGEIIDVQPFRLSGLWSIDEAAINSFKQVKNVPNPPAEMIDENGYIHMQFQTEVYWIPRPGPTFHGNN